MQSPDQPQPTGTLTVPRSPAPNGNSYLQHANWPALRLLNQYRLFLIVALGAIFYLTAQPMVLGQHAPDLFKLTHGLYLVLAIVFNLIISRQKFGLETQFYLHAYADILVLSTIVYSSGGIASDVGMLLILHIAIIGHFTRLRFALLFAAITSSVLLSQELYLHLGADAVNFTKAAITCITIFFFAILTSCILPGKTAVRSPDEGPMSMRQLSELNRKIVQELEAGVLYVDPDHKVQLANGVARELLGQQDVMLPKPLASLSRELHAALIAWAKQPELGNRPVPSPDQSRDLLPGFTLLSTGGLLIKLEDHGLIKQQMQQLKLASLGRLSASIAHEIRNPLGAISNAVQLLAESPALEKEDQALIDIAENHTRRINSIIENVMHISTVRQSKTAYIWLGEALSEFQERFDTHPERGSSRLIIEMTSDALISFDAQHLDQVLWNLCVNAIMHNEGQAVTITIRVHYVGTDRLTLEIADDGRGISSSEQDAIFEPFYTTHNAGTGLGLYIIRDLCELNNATITYSPSPHGACFQISLSASQQRLAA